MGEPAFLSDEFSGTTKADPDVELVSTSGKFFESTRHFIESTRHFIESTRECPQNFFKGISFT